MPQKKKSCIHNIVKNDSHLITAMLVVILMLISRDVLGISISNLVVTIVCVLAMFSLKYEKMVPMIFFMFPIMCGVPGYIMSFAYILLIIKGPKLGRKQIIPLIIVIFLEILNESYHLVDGLYTGILSFFSFTAVFFYFLDESKNSSYLLQKSLVFYGVGTAFVFLVIYINMFREYGVEAVLGGMLRSGAMGAVDNDVTKMSGHLALNANTIAYLSISVVSIFSVMLVYIKKCRIFFFCIIAICFIAGVLSFSRTFIAVAALFYTLYFLCLRGANKIKFLGLVLFVCVLFLCLYGDMFVSITDAFMGRAKEDNISTAGGRTILFKLYNEAWLSNIKYIIWGTGVVSYRQELQVYNAMHNGLQQIWVCLGISGLLLYVIRITTYLKHVYCGRIIFYLPFFVTLVMDQSIQFLAPYPLVLVLLVTMQFPKVARVGKITAN